MPISEGTTPGISVSRPGRADSSGARLSRGIDVISPRVYGWRGCANSAFTGACSTMRPAYITTTRCAVSAITPRSCVISITAAPVRAFISSISARICAWIVTSSAVVGSSAMSRAGVQAIAIAIITRWRMPPES